MIVLYKGSGAGDLYLTGSKMPSEQMRTIKHNVSRLLAARNNARAVEILDSFPFEIMDSSNFFNDEFLVLYANVLIEQYEQVRKLKDSYFDKIAFKDIAETFTELGTYIRFIVAELRLTWVTQIEHPCPHITSDVVERALTDAKQLLQSTGATSGVDRAHTALHGYLHAVCKQKQINCKSDANLNELLKLVLLHHQSFKDASNRKEDIDRVFKAFGTILDALNPIRNRASIAHPNEELLKEAEAMLVINSAWTILHYIDAKLKELA